MKFLLAFILISIFSKSFSQAKDLYSLKGYFIIFANNFKEDSLILTDKKNGAFITDKLTTNFSTGITDVWYRLDSSYFKSHLIVQLFEKNKKIDIFIKKNKKMKFIYVWFYEGKLSYKVYDKLLEAE